jgi:hypothetical protein
MSEKKASEQEKLNQTEAQGQVETEVASIEAPAAQTQQRKAMVLRLYFGNVHKDEVFLMLDDAVPPQINEFIGAFLQSLDAVWTPNPSNQRAYRVRNITAYEVQPITLNIQQPAEVASESESEQQA